jgi:hypothetical protein
VEHNFKGNAVVLLIQAKRPLSPYSRVSTCRNAGLVTEPK